MNGQHLSKTDAWWTPPEIVDPARAMFGGFGLDPASCEGANRIIKAHRFFAAHDDGLAREWRGRVVWCNPPSKRGESSAWQWWVHGARQWAEGRCSRLFFVVFNPSSFFQVALAHALDSGVPTPQQAARVDFRKRIRYLASGDSPQPGKAPPHGSALLLLTSRVEDWIYFAQVYADLGDCVVPSRIPCRRLASPSLEK